MKVLVACEYSGRVRRAFAERGHEVYSCDLLPADDGETIHHYQGDVFDIINSGWDLMIAFPVFGSGNISTELITDKSELAETIKTLQIIHDAME